MIERSATGGGRFRLRCAWHILLGTVIFSRVPSAAWARPGIPAGASLQSDGGALKFGDLSVDAGGELDVGNAFGWFGTLPPDALRIPASSTLSLLILSIFIRLAVRFGRGRNSLTNSRG